MDQVIIEVVLLRNDFDTEFYALQIRQLAAQYQSGAELSEIKALVDKSIKSMESILQYDCDYQLQKWSELFESLHAYANKFSDPDWMTVMSYARKQVSRKKGAANARHKYLHQIT